MNEQPIPWSASNPDKEIVAIKAHNRLGELHCGWTQLRGSYSNASY